ncbi:MAG TPA: cupin domain-containing protein [Candidatus Deferrimicrobiaceae bacterium]
MLIRQVKEMARFDPAAPVKLQVSDGTHCRTTVWCLEIGQEIHPHAHAGDHVWTIVEGEGWVVSGTSDPLLVEPGSLFFAPAGEPHGIKAGTRLVFVSVTAG